MLVLPPVTVVLSRSLLGLFHCARALWFSMLFGPSCSCSLPSPFSGLFHCAHAFSHCHCPLSSSSPLALWLLIFFYIFKRFSPRRGSVGVGTRGGDGEQGGTLIASASPRCHSYPLLWCIVSPLDFKPQTRLPFFSHNNTRLKDDFWTMPQEMLLNHVMVVFKLISQSS